MFLSLDQVLQVHASLIDHYGGSAGLRDVSLLQSALAQPEATFDGKLLHADLFEMAAAYLYHLVMNHPFVDGNKRTGAASAIIFLTVNDIEFQGTEEGVVEITLGVARGDVQKPEVAAYFRGQSTVLEG